jgi:hypothetical protein
MICYRDKTFCPYWKDCECGEICGDALTDKVIEQAVKWWGKPDAPICQFSAKPDCWIPKDDK